MPAVEHGNGQQVEQPEVERNRRHEREERDPAQLSRLARELGNRHRAHQLPRRRLPDEQTANRFEDETAELDVPADAQRDGFERTGLERPGRLADLNADEAAIAALFRGDGDVLIASVAPNGQIDRMPGVP